MGWVCMDCMAVMGLGRNLDQYLSPNRLIDGSVAPKLTEKSFGLKLTKRLVNSLANSIEVYWANALLSFE